MSKIFDEDPLMFGDDFWETLGWMAAVLGVLALVGLGSLVYAVWRLLT